MPHTPSAPAAATAAAPAPRQHVDEEFGGEPEARETLSDPMLALRVAFPSSMASMALDQLRIARLDDGVVELVGPVGAIGIFRARIDDVSRALSGALGRRVRALLTAESMETGEGEGSGGPASGSVTMEAVKDHPLVAAARRAFNAEVQRVDPIPNRPSAPEPNA